MMDIHRFNHARDDTLITSPAVSHQTAPST